MVVLQDDLLDIAWGPAYIPCVAANMIQPEGGRRLDSGLKTKCGDVEGYLGAVSNKGTPCASAGWQAETLARFKRLFPRHTRPGALVLSLAPLTLLTRSHTWLRQAHKGESGNQSRCEQPLCMAAGARLYSKRPLQVYRG